jgi:hypothetical protein
MPKIDRSSKVRGNVGHSLTATGPVWRAMDEGNNLAPVAKTEDESISSRRAELCHIDPLLGIYRLNQ